MKESNQSSSRAAVDAGATPTLHMNFRNAPLKTVLDYLSDATGVAVDIKANVALNNRVDAWSSEPMAYDQALGLLEQVLHKTGCTLIQHGRRLAIMRTAEAKKSYIPIRLAKNHQGILNGTASRSLFTSAASPWAN